jgi:bifunctional NMN adenylyltransferase/nudix hydrolase
MKQYADLAVFIGRFQPLHLGHVHAIKQGMTHANHVLVLMGDTGGPRTIKNPWTYEERKQMLMRSLPADCASAPDCEPRVIIRRLQDFRYRDHEWLSEVHNLVSSTAEYLGVGGNKPKIILIGHEKDASSFYLKKFPMWDFVDTGFEEFDGQHQRCLDATVIRDFIFNKQLGYTVGVLSREVRDHIHYLDTLDPSILDGMRVEREFIRKYRQSWSTAPFPPVFVTTDAVVIQSGHILMIRRKDNPGAGQWALPGGFIDQTESIEDCCIRELIEETNIHLQPEVLKRCITNVTVFDRAGGVSSEDRGRIITHAHLIKLNDEKDFPKVVGGDDAAEAAWISLGELDPRKIFSDHNDIINVMLGKL